MQSVGRADTEAGLGGGLSHPFSHLRCKAVVAMESEETPPEGLDDPNNSEALLTVQALVDDGSITQAK